MGAGDAIARGRAMARRVRGRMMKVKEADVVREGRWRLDLRARVLSSVCTVARCKGEGSVEGRRVFFSRNGFMSFY